MTYNIAYYMDIGQRENQEDCLFVNGLTVQQDMMKYACTESVNAPGGVFAVCDGMGGHAGGEWASSFVCEKMKEFMKDISFSHEYILNMFREIQRKMEIEGMKNSGSTTACVMLKGNASKIYNIGDIRVYKITKKEILTLSHDHSLVQSMVDKGELSGYEAKGHPYRHIIEFGLGDVFKRQWNTNDKKVYMQDDILNANEYYLLCTDGVNDVLSDAEIHDLLSPDPFDRLHEFIDYLGKRMKDNTSFIVVGKKG
jgi:serine/threonine protein phosphatase PrpC